MQKSWTELDRPERDYMLAKIQAQEAVMSDLMAALWPYIEYHRNTWERTGNGPACPCKWCQQARSAIARAKEGEEAK